MENYKQIVLLKEIIFDENISENGILAYVALSFSDLGTSYNGFFYYEQLEANLTGRGKPIGYGKYAISKRIKSGIFELSDYGLIDILSEERRGVLLDLNRILYKKNPDNEVKPFVLIRDYEIKAILTSGHNSKELLLRYFISIISTINGNKKNNSNLYAYGVSISSIEHIASLSYITKQTAIEYNKILVDLDLICIVKSNILKIQKGEVQGTFTNCYCRKEFLNDAIELQDRRQLYSELDCNTIFMNREVNRRRKAAQMNKSVIRFISRDYTLRKTYTYQEIKDHYEYCLNQNKIFKKNIKTLEKCVEKGVLSKLDADTRINKLKERIYDLSDIEKWLESNA